MLFFFFFSSRRRHTRCSRDWSSDVCSSDLSPQILGTWGESRGNEEFVRPAGDRWMAGSRRDPLLCLASCRPLGDRKSTRLNSSHGYISYAVFCLKKKKKHDG